MITIQQEVLQNLKDAGCNEAAVDEISEALKKTTGALRSGCSNASADSFLTRCTAPRAAYAAWIILCTS